MVEVEVPKKELKLSDNHMCPYTEGSPVDYTFRKINQLSQLSNVMPRSKRVKVPKRGSTDKYISRTVWISYNKLVKMEDITNIVDFSLDKPELIAWVDLSYNELNEISEELTRLINLKILYLHGNNISLVAHVMRLKNLIHLRQLTLHGNPVETIPGYRQLVVNSLPQIKRLDFSLVLSSERYKILNQ